MARSCSICTHDRRDELEEALITGGGYRAIALQHGVSRDALSRHVNSGHVPVAIALRGEAEEAHRAASLTERAEFLWRRAESILEAADGRPNLELQAIRELRAVVELLGRLTNAVAVQERVPVIVNLRLHDGTALPRYIPNEEDR